MSRTIAKIAEHDYEAQRQLQCTAVDSPVESEDKLKIDRLLRPQGTVVVERRDTLGNRRFEWKCNALNAPSRRAAIHSRNWSSR